MRAGGGKGVKPSDKGIEQPDSRFFEIPGIARHDGQVEDERDGGDLFVDRVVRVNRHQFSPDLGARRIERQDPVVIFFGQQDKPVFKGANLGKITPLTDHFETPTDFSDRLDGEIQEIVP